MTAPSSSRRILPSLEPPRTAGAAAAVLGLALVWCGLWGSFALPELSIGLVVGAVIVTTTGTGSGLGVRPLPLLRLAAVVGADLVRSTVGVAAEVLTPTDRTDELLVEVPLGDAGRRHLLLLTVAVTLTPGTAVVEADPDSGTLLIHLLHAEGLDDTVAHVHRMARLAEEALPS